MLNTYQEAIRAIVQAKQDGNGKKLWWYVLAMAPGAIVKAYQAMQEDDKNEG